MGRLESMSTCFLILAKRPQRTSSMSPTASSATLASSPSPSTRASSTRSPRSSRSTRTGATQPRSSPPHFGTKREPRSALVLTTKRSKLSQRRSREKYTEKKRLWIAIRQGKTGSEARFEVVTLVLRLGGQNDKEAVYTS